MRTLTLLLDPDSPAQTRMSLRAAADRRGVAWTEVVVSAFDPLTPPLPPGDLLFTPGISAAAFEAQAALWQPGVGTVFRGPQGPLRMVTDPATALVRAGLPMPREVRVRSAQPAFLARVVQALGGLPVIVRADGGEGGERVSRADSMPGLVSLVGMLLSLGHAPRLVAFVPEAVHWRVVVVAGVAVAAYVNPLRDDDFRSEPTDEPTDYTATPPAGIAEPAIAACEALGVDLGGVDVLLHPSGRPYLLEVNTPCYFAQSERFGLDVAGPLIDALVHAATP